MNTRPRSQFGLRIALLISLGLLLGEAASADPWWQKAKDFLSGSEAGETAASELSEGDIAGGLKEALLVGTRRVVKQLGQEGGFAADPAIHIPLPEGLEKVQSALDGIGMSGMLDDLELRLNRAAEIAAPKARKLFVQAIKEMTLDDVMNVYQGPEDAATRYFQGKMSEPLGAEMYPVVEESLADAGAAQAYSDVMTRYNAIPFVPQVDADLSRHVVDRGMDGIFFYLAKEEAAIREDPAARTTELLRRVFGG